MDDTLVQLRELTLQLTQRDDQLVKSEKLLRAILDASPVGICLIRNRMIVWVNKIMTTMFGYTPEEFNYMPTSKLYVDDEEYESIGQVIYGMSRIPEAGTNYIELATRMKAKCNKEMDVIIRVTFVDPSVEALTVVAILINLGDMRKLCEKYTC